MKALELADLVTTHFDYTGDLLTNKKLQKLLYYVESWSLVHTSSIIDEDFEAWVHGPVIPVVYQQYKKFGYSPINNEYADDDSASSKLERIYASLKIGDEQHALIQQVLNKYGALSSYQLEMLSHSENPWKHAREGLSDLSHSSSIIRKDIMKDYYSSLIKK